jgi:uncharacterized membrane protein YgdD (TMEM256/DUF423 family)
MNKRFLVLSACGGALSVIAGAMLSHPLKPHMPVESREIFETAVRYQFYHVFALMACGVLSERFPGFWINRAGNCFIFGILFFSGSLYIISALKSTGSSVPVALGILTPLGGLLLILGWIFLGLSVWKKNPS